MAYCPQDRIDYDDEIEECVVCGGPLIEGSVEDLFEEIKTDEWVEMDPVPELVHAVRIRDALDEEQVPCYIKADLPPGSEYYGDQAVICIPESHYDNALEIQQGIAPPDDDQLLYDPDSEDDW